MTAWITFSSSVHDICSGFWPRILAITIRRERTCRWTRMLRSVDLSSDEERLLLCLFCRDCIIAIRGYNFQEGQHEVSTGRICASVAAHRRTILVAASPLRKLQNTSPLDLERDFAPPRTDDQKNLGSNRLAAPPTIWPAPIVVDRNLESVRRQSSHPMEAMANAPIKSIARRRPRQNGTVG